MLTVTPRGQLLGGWVGPPHRKLGDGPLDQLLLGKSASVGAGAARDDGLLGGAATGCRSNRMAKMSPSELRYSLAG